MNWMAALLLGLQDEPPEFYRDVQPVLAIHCVKCHGPDSQKGGLRFDLKASALKAGKSGERAIVPGDPHRSALVRRVASADAEERMPPKGAPLSTAQVAVLRRWVAAGAPWPDRDDYWAFRPPGRSPIAHDIDGFILAKLRARGLTPSPPASRHVLLRRLYADLLGVPPSPREARDFLEDGSPDGYERLVDRLLSDPRYGERWARHWLDLVRYADSDGFGMDGVRPHAWRYRDYVIRSLNEDKPYDRFVMEQVAGDELFPGDPDALVATGFLRLGPWDAACPDAKHRWHEFLNEVTHTTGSVFLGLTVGCARCHDHKYDRVTQRDYFALQAFFAGATRTSKPLPDMDPPHVRRKLAEIRARAAPLRAELNTFREEHRRLVIVRKLQEGAGDEVGATDDEVKASLDQAQPKKRETLEGQIKNLEASADPYRPAAEVVVDAASPPPKTHVLRRGLPDSPGEEVQPGFIAALVDGDGSKPGESPHKRGSLARWLASPVNPLTARVMMNRLWQYHFGRGLVATPSDFGRNGAQPTHPELLDWLACEFTAGGRTLKRMHRLILTSATYRQSSEFRAEAAAVDPENRLLWRKSRRRLEAEAVRDSILAVSGRLDLRHGGPGVYPRIHDELFAETRATGDRPALWGETPEADTLRRTVYVAQRRSVMIPLIQAFDGAGMNQSCPQRAGTTVPSQVLAMMNDEFVRKEARHFAERARREGTDPIETAYRLAFARSPTDDERRGSSDFLREQARRYVDAGQEEKEALTDLCQVILNTNEFLYID